MDMESGDFFSLSFERSDSLYIPIDGAQTSQIEEFSFDVLGPNDIVNLMNAEISDVVKIIKTPKVIGRLLLDHFKWDKERLLERYFDESQANIFDESQVPNPNLFEKAVPHSDNVKICVICDDGDKEMVALACNHEFCRHCYVRYIKQKIVDEGISDSIRCLSFQCQMVVDDATILNLITEEEVKIKYQQLITNNFVQYNRLMKFCPSPNCSNAIKVIYVDSRPVRCKCSYVFCYECNAANHEPISCGMLKKWLKKSADDKENFLWIEANTKNCPNCHVSIEKNGGCMRMPCYKCGYNFCWSCLAKFLNYSHACNVYDLQNSGKNDLNSKWKPERYIHYLQRYINHKQAIELEKKFYVLSKTHMDQLVGLGMNWVEVYFLEKAVDILLQCRLSLMHSYVFAYYLDKNNQSIIFEENQRDLESATEKLSDLLEEEGCKFDIKQEILDKYNYCEKRRKVLLDHVQEGYMEKWWTEDYD